MHPSETNGHRTRGRPRQRSRTHSDPGHPHVIPPYTIRWPAPARQATGPVWTRGTPYQRSRSPFVAHAGSPAHYQVTSSPDTTSSSTPVSPRSLSPQRSRDQASSSRQVSTPQGPAPLIRDVPQPPRALPSVPSPPPLAGWQGIPVPSQHPPALTPSQTASMQRQGSHHSIHRQPLASVYQNASTTHASSHHSSQHNSSSSYYPVRHRSRSRPPSAASHRYASSITQPVYGHRRTAASNTLPDSPPVQRNRSTTPPLPSASTGTEPTYLSSGSPQRSRSYTRAPPSSTHGSTTTARSVRRAAEAAPSPQQPPMLTAREIRRTTQRPALPANFDDQLRTRYVHMLLALDDISPIFNVLALFFTWVLLAGFLLFPATFASWKNAPAGTPQSDILSVVNHVSLYVFAWICTAIGACGMIWLWWRWRENYIWITNRIFVPGCLNSAAGVISTLSNVFGVQGGVFGKTEMSTLIVTGALSLTCGILVLVYEFWLVRNLKLEHDQLVGAERAGEHGEGIQREKRGGWNRGA